MIKRKFVTISRCPHEIYFTNHQVGHRNDFIENTQRDDDEK